MIHYRAAALLVGAVRECTDKEMRERNYVIRTVCNKTLKTNRAVTCDISEVTCAVCLDRCSQHAAGLTALAAQKVRNPDA